MIIGICPKVNIIVWLEFELSYYDITVQNISYRTTRTSLLKISIVIILIIRNYNVKTVCIVGKLLGLSETYAGHCWRSRDELIRDVLLWTPTHGRAKAGRLARTYIQQLCEDTGCCPEDLPRAMNDREEWRERVRDICATSVIWWWWWWIRYAVCLIHVRFRR